MSKRNPKRLIGDMKGLHQISNRDYRRALERHRKKKIKRSK